MSDDFRRRRRLSNTGTPRRSNGSNGMNPWIVTVFAAIVVVVGGWFLGQALARVFNGPPKNETVAQAPTPLPIVTPPPSPSAAPTIEATPTPTPTATPHRKPTQAPSVAPEPSPTPTPQATLAPTPMPTPLPTATPAPKETPTPKATPVPVEQPPLPQAASPAEHVVRSYIDALRRGDPATAATFLGNGEPDESFIDSATRINSMTSTRNSDGSYKVVVDMHTAAGEYNETFTVASDRILEKSAVKP